MWRYIWESNPLFLSEVISIIVIHAVFLFLLFTSFGIYKKGKADDSPETVSAILSRQRAEEEMELKVSELGQEVAERTSRCRALESELTEARLLLDSFNSMSQNTEDYDSLKSLLEVVNIYILNTRVFQKLIPLFFCLHKQYKGEIADLHETHAKQSCEIFMLKDEIALLKGSSIKSPNSHRREPEVPLSPEISADPSTWLTGLFGTNQTKAAESPEPKSPVRQAQKEEDAKSKVVREAAEANAKARADKETAEAKAKADREAAEADARAKADREAAEAEAKAKADREAAEADARAKVDREAAEADAKAKADREARVKADREAAEARTRADREAAEAGARAKADREAAEADARAKVDREAAEARAKADREATEAEERADREAAEKATNPVKSSKSKTSLAVIEAVKDLSQEVVPPDGDPMVLFHAAQSIQKIVRGYLRRKKTKSTLENVPHLIVFDVKTANDLLRNPIH